MNNNTSWKKDYLRYKDFFLNILSLYNTKPNLKIYLELILSISTVILFSIFAIRPTILTIIELNKEIKAKEEISLKLNQKIKNLQTVSNLLQTESENLLYIDQAVPKKANPEVLIKYVENLSKENSLQLISLTSSNILLIGKEMGNKKKSDFVKLPNDSNELPLTVSLSGSYQNAFSFLQKFENFRQPIKIDSFIMNSNTVDGNSVVVLTITGRVPIL